MTVGYQVGIGRGVGLRSVDEQLRRTYGPEHGLEIRANVPHGTVVNLRIPVESRE